MIGKLTPCIVMNGRATEAIRFYEEVLDVSVLHIQTYGEMPMPCPEALKERVAHAILRIGESELMMFDAPDSNTDHVRGQSIPHDGGAVVTINISISSVEKTRQIYGALQQGGTVIAPLESVPFSPAFGTITDKFGVTFILVTQG